MICLWRGLSRIPVWGFDTYRCLGYTAAVARTRDYLTELLTTYWFAPPVALWRAIELRVAAAERYERPLLDLGCGDGLIGQALFGPGERVDVGFDLWSGQLRRAAWLGVYRHLDLADGHHMPYPNGAFATVFSNSVLEHIPDVGAVVRGVGRVLRPGGRFVFTVPSDYFRILLDGYVWRVEAGDARGAEAYAAAVDTWLEHHHYHTPTEWRRLLAGAGMTLVKACYYIPEEVERLWDRMNVRYGVNRSRSAWGMLVSPHLRSLGYQVLLRRLVVRSLSRRWRPYYEMDVPPGDKGGGLLVVARREE
jgi:SAM-dependent methyltransferase